MYYYDWYPRSKSINNRKKHYSGQFFLSIPFAKELLKEKKSIIHTLRKNKRKLPNELLRAKRVGRGTLESSTFEYKKKL